MKITKGQHLRVKSNANFSDMSAERFGQAYPAPHRNEVGIVVDWFDEMPVLRFADGSTEQYSVSSLDRPSILFSALHGELAL